MKKINGDLVHKDDLELIGLEMGDRLKSFRTGRNLTVQELSQKAQVPEFVITQIELGQKVVSVVLAVRPQDIISG